MDFIMVIDDSPTIRTSVQIVINDLGYPIEQAENGKDALEKIENIKSNGDDVSLCVTDTNMPVMDGIDFIREFRKSDKFTPIIVVSTESSEGKIQEGMDLGASGWMIKPFKPDELVKTVSKVIR